MPAEDFIRFEPTALTNFAKYRQIPRSKAMENVQLGKVSSQAPEWFTKRLPEAWMHQGDVSFVLRKAKHGWTATNCVSKRPIPQEIPDPPNTAWTKLSMPEIAQQIVVSTHAAYRLKQRARQQDLMDLIGQGIVTDKIPVWANASNKQEPVIVIHTDDPIVVFIKQDINIVATTLVSQNWAQKDIKNAVRRLAIPTKTVKAWIKQEGLLARKKADVEQVREDMLLLIKEQATTGYGENGAWLRVNHHEFSIRPVLGQRTSLWRLEPKPS